MNQQTVTNSKLNITGFHLKLIAMISMTIDHIGAVVLARLQDSGNLFWQQEIIDSLYFSLRFIGRFAFPLYCFMLIEGFFHTRSRRNYALRLFVMAVLSEIPYDLALHGTWYFPQQNNVFVTLLLGLLMMWSISTWNTFCRKFFAVGKKKEWESTAVTLGTVGIAFAAVLCMIYICKSDYGIAGVITILCMYLLHSRPVCGFTVGCSSIMLLHFSALQAAALLMIPVISRYNGQRGTPMKFLFYGYYPLHLLLLVGICAVLHILPISS